MEKFALTLLIRIDGMSSVVADWMKHDAETSTYSDGLVLVAKVSLYQVDIVV